MLGCLLSHVLVLFVKWKIFSLLQLCICVASPMFMTSDNVSLLILVHSTFLMFCILKEASLIGLLLYFLLQLYGFMHMSSLWVEHIMVDHRRLKRAAVPIKLDLLELLPGNWQTVNCYLSLSLIGMDINYKKMSISQSELFYWWLAIFFFMIKLVVSLIRIAISIML